MNAETSESKAYGARGFKPGLKGSRMAQRWYMANSKDKFSMEITNDLILLREDKPGNWVSAKKGDENILMVSESTYNKWTNLPEAIKAAVPLKTFDEENKNPQKLVSLKWTSFGGGWGIASD